ncbi:hypothetical protein [Actinokineospora enzanensis]|uniref:hypothetical protein n=1 Tax=Actinokineospora enzanensis TaxID=155975 RepID=UPI00039FD3FD|nr:hypothetical protein [Actinokineospora enzanensis]
MRRSLTGTLLLLGLAACGTPAGTTDAPPQAAVANKSNPCELVPQDTVTKSFPDDTVGIVVATGFDPKNPPANGSLQERNCGYTVTGPDTQLTVMVTTYGEDAAGSTWKALEQGGQIATTGPNAVEHKPVTNIGDAAFSSGPGDLTAHKGTTIVHVWSPDDADGTLDNRKAAAIMLQALAH